ncbi:MAG: translocation/assembly module TamB, partial [Bacteroidales bacterium]|nr:translocation/assembly module TamB [Bacteroidales bacterium]
FLSGTIKGQIDTLFCNGYAYSSIDVDAKLSSQKVGGKFSVEDPNLKMDFIGGVDFSVETPEIKFASTIEQANLEKLHLFSDAMSSISFSTQVDLYGADLDDLNGIASIRNLEYSNAKGTIATKNIALNFSNEKKKRNIALRSAFADAEIDGHGSYEDLYNNMVSLLAENISALPYTAQKGEQDSEFTFSATIKNIDTVFSLLLPDLRIKNGTTCSAVYSKEKNTASVDLHFPRCSYGSVVMYNGDISIDCDETGILVNTKCNLDSDSKSDNTFYAECSVVKDSLALHTAWKLADALQTYGKCSILGAMQTKKVGQLPKFVLQIQPSQFYFADSLWNIAQSHIVVDTTSVSVSGFCLSKDAKKIHVDGVISENSNDYVVLDVENYDLSELNALIGSETVRLAGQIQGRVRVKNVYATPLIFADINSGMVSFNEHELGSLKFRSFWENKQKALLLKALIMREKENLVAVEGKYSPYSDSLRCLVSCNNLNLNVFDEVLQGVVDDLAGIINGDVNVSGTLSSMDYSGELEATGGSLTVSYTNVPYKFSGKLRAQKTRFLFSDFTITDAHRNTGDIRGFVDIKDITNPHYRIDIASPKILVMNTTAKDNDYFYGTIYYNGTAKIEGDLNETDISANGRSLENTVCSIPVSYSELSGAYDFLSFSIDTTTQILEKPTAASGITMNMTLAVTPDALAQIVFDPKVGDVIKARGNGDLQVKMDKDGELRVYGKYQIEEGEYLFTLKNLINKKLILQKGGTIAWNGDPLNAQVNLTAHYETKASPQPLFDSTVSATKRIPVTCKAMLQNNLMSPDISYDIAVPSSATQVSEVLSTLSEDEKTLQFLSLMLQGSFMAVSSSTVGGSVSFEVLSNQINNLLSQLDPNLDVNVNYRLGTDNATNNEFEFGISRQFWNDRILVNVNGYTDFGGTNSTDATSATSQANDFSGNVSVEMKVNKKGTLKVKGFSRSNDDELSEKQENTNGLGFSFTKDFNTLREFFRKEK